MKLNIEVKKDNVIYSLGFLNKCEYVCLCIENEFIIHLYKEHNHCYYFKAFFYRSKRICSYHYFRSKKELYRAVQLLLKEELYNVIQF